VAAGAGSAEERAGGFTGSNSGTARGAEQARAGSDPAEEGSRGRGEESRGAVAGFSTQEHTTSGASQCGTGQCKEGQISISYACAVL